MVLSNTLRWQWLQLLRFGRMNASDPRALPTVDSASGFPEHIATGVIGRSRAGQVESVTDFATARCNLLESLDINRHFWWVN